MEGGRTAGEEEAQGGRPSGRQGLSRNTEEMSWGIKGDHSGGRDARRGADAKGQSGQRSAGTGGDHEGEGRAHGCPRVTVPEGAHIAGHRVATGVLHEESACTDRQPHHAVHLPGQGVVNGDLELGEGDREGVWNWGGGPGLCPALAWLRPINLARQTKVIQNNYHHPCTPSAAALSLLPCAPPPVGSPPPGARPRHLPPAPPPPGSRAPTSG